MEYGKILRKLRKERNMSQEEVALFAGAVTICILYTITTSHFILY